MFPTAVQNDNSLLKEVVRGLFELTFSNAFRYMHRHQHFNIYINYLACKSLDLEYHADFLARDYIYL
jgi:hypothetical protein